jgi:hypothetical protein
MAEKKNNNKSQKICSLMDIFFGKIVVAISRMNLGKTIELFKVEKDCIWLDMAGKQKLYALKIEGADNQIKRFGDKMEKMIPSIRFIENSDIGIFFVKRDGIQSVYLYAFDGRIIGQLSKDFRIPNLKGEDIIASLFDCLLAQKYVVEDNRILAVGAATKPFVPYGLEMSSGKFKAKAMVAIDNLLRDYTIYQGEEYESVDTFNPINLFRADWEGSLWIWINFSSNAIDARIKQYESTAKFADKVFARECMDIIKKTDEELTRMIRTESVIINSFLLLKDESSLNVLSSEVNIQFSKNYLTGPSVLSKTLLMSRDSDFDAIVPKEVALRYLASSHKKQTPPGFVCDFYGFDISGNFVEYSFANNDNPHCALFGKTGSGKSVQAILITEKIIGYSHETEEASRFYNQKFRYADVGFTSGNLVSKLKIKYPNDVEIFGSDVSTLRFGLLDYDLQPNGLLLEEDMNFLSSFVSFVLEIEATEPLTGLERTAFEESVNGLLNESQENELYILDLEKFGGYDVIIAELKAKGCTSHTKLNTLDSSYGFLKRRTIVDLLNYINPRQSSMDLSDDDKKIYSTLATKIKVISTNRMINAVANVQVGGSKHFFHIDFNSIKNDKRSFNISYWMLMKSWLKDMEASAIPRLNRGEKPETVFFFIEEAHNFFTYKSFAGILQTAAKEIRKFGGRLFFITQSIEDIPKTVLSELSTKMIIASEAEKERYKKIVRDIYEQKDMEKIDEVIDNLSDRMLMIMGDHGVIGCKLELTGPEQFYKPKKIL